MSFELDAQRCLKCGACVRECAFKALRTGPDGIPVLVDETKCTHCQHCFAACPVGAITLDGHCADDAVAMDEEPELPGAAAVENWMHLRRSVRRFQDVDLDREWLERMLVVLGNAPTGCNARELTFTCYPDRAAMNVFKGKFLAALGAHRDGTKLLPRWLAAPAIRMRRGGEDLFFRDAPALVIVSADEMKPGVVTPEADVFAACAYLELLASSYGFSTCWCGFLNLIQQEVPELLEVTSGIRRSSPFGAMLVGYAAYSYPRGVLRDGEAQVVIHDAPKLA